MRILYALLPLAGFVVLQESKQEEPPPISVRLEVTASGDQFLIEEVHVDAALSDVWAAYTTAEGWRAWAAVEADVDLSIGGTIRTHYTEGAKIGDPGTNTLHIVNYVPERVLTLRADVSKNWPEIMKKDAARLSNVILFDPIDEQRTRIRSYGIGYRDTPEYERLLTFFESANTGLYEKLITYLEAD